MSGNGNGNLKGTGHRVVTSDGDVCPECGKQLCLIINISAERVDGEFCENGDFENFWTAAATGVYNDYIGER